MDSESRVRGSRRGTVALGVSVVALFVALGGGAYAVHVAKRNSVTSKSIKNGAVAGIDVADDSLTGLDVDEGTLNLPTGSQGATGPQGPTGATGAAGPNGAAGSALAYARVSPTGALDPNFTENVSLVVKGTGTYCLNVTTAQAPKSLNATIDVAVTDGRKGDVSATLDTTAIKNTGCPAATDALVITTFWQPGGAVAQVADGGFYVDFD